MINEQILSTCSFFPGKYFAKDCNKCFLLNGALCLFCLYTNLPSFISKQSISFSYKIPFSNNIVTIIKSKFNGGYAFGNNIAIKHIFECNPLSYVWVLNNDTMVENNSLKFDYNSSICESHNSETCMDCDDFYHLENQTCAL